MMRRPSGSEIVEAVVAASGCTRAELQSHSRMPSLNRARLAVIRVCRKTTRLSYGAIGGLINRDHTSAARMDREYRAHPDRYDGAAQVIARALRVLEHKLAEPQPFEEDGDDCATLDAAGEAMPGDRDLVRAGARFTRKMLRMRALTVELLELLDPDQTPDPPATRSRVIELRKLWGGV